KKRAQEDENWDVRGAAVQALARAFKDDSDLFEFWCDSTLNNPFEGKYFLEDNPRRTALKVLVQRYLNHPKTHQILKDRAQNDTDEELRAWATKQLKKLEGQ
ncbi:MAG TPA: HEAT repeat domain-containing protein, partial [Leptolyngbyaceae cyanobacterium]